jgi:multiple sugar transport system permease protein
MKAKLEGNSSNKMSLLFSRVMRLLRNNILSLAVLIPSAFLILIPFLWMLTTSLKPRGMVGSPPYLFPTVFNIENYLTAWRAAPFLRYYLNTTIVAIAVISSRIVIAGMAAYAFSVMKFKGKNLLFLAFLGTMMVPSQATLIPSYMIILDLGWMNTYRALIIPRMVDAFSIFLLRQRFISIPKDYIDAAKLDGCSHWRLLWQIVMPMSRSTVITMSLFSFLFVWNDFLWPLLVANTNQLRTIQVGLQAFSGQYITEWTFMMAGTVTATIIPILVFFIAQNYFVSGLTRSGLKG